MMKYFSFIVVLSMSACSSMDDATSAESSAGGSPPGSGYELNNETRDVQSVCDKARTKQTVEVNGEHIVLDVPTLCDPTWEHRGDPQPDRFIDVVQFVKDFTRKQ